MNYRQVAASVAKSKQKHPERYCPVPNCLWRTGNGKPCPRHKFADESKVAEMSFERWREDHDGGCLSAESYDDTSCNPGADHD